MTRARWQDGEYEVVKITENYGEWVLRDDDGDVIVFEAHSLPERVEVQCERCGRWSERVIPLSESRGRWVCADTECYDAESGRDKED